MARQISMLNQFPPVSLLAPAADAAGRTSSYRSLRNADGKVFVVFEVNQGNAATVLFSILQAKDSSGTGSKAIAASPVSLDNDTSVSDAFVAQTAAATFTTDATTKNKLVYFELVPEIALDVANGFEHIAVSTGASNAANITRAEMFVYGSYQGASAPTSYV